MLFVNSWGVLTTPKTFSMAAPQLGCSNSMNQHPVATVPKDTTDTAVENRASKFTRRERRAAAPLDPFTFYNMYVDTDVRLLSNDEEFQSQEDGYTCFTGAATACDDAQPQARDHTATYKLAVRLANRSNGAPLATIIEQGSYSTLNSHGSLLSVGRFPSSRAAEDTSPKRGPRRRSRSLDEKILHDIPEDLTREYDASSVAVPPAKPSEEHVGADSASGTATPVTSHRFELRQSPSSQSGDELFDRDNRGVKGFIRGVLQNVRGVSRTRSRSSSMTQAPIMEHQESPPCARESSSQVEQQYYQSPKVTHVQGYTCNVPIRSSEAAAVTPSSGDQTRTHAIASITSPPAGVYPYSSHCCSDVAKYTTVLGSIPPVLPYRAATRSCERPFFTPIVSSVTSDVASERGAAQASTFPHDTFDTSARYTFDGVPLYPRQPSSLRETTSARQVFTNQNASFCSTATSSYSGTILGIDLDLQHDLTYPIRRSQSPPTPVWFTPQMAELERQASWSEPRGPVKTKELFPTFTHSITSSALTSLLPIAAESGIVRPNFDTPKISFYSPSGNLIQPEGSSPQGTASSRHDASPRFTTSHYNRHSHATPPGGSLPTRPPLVPMTTLPNRETPLPPRLRHHHKHHHPEMSLIGSCEPSITRGKSVKGCDGVVREDSLTPRSGIHHPNRTHRIHRSTTLILHDLKAEAKFYKARFLAQAAAQSFAPSLPRGRTLQKRHMHEYKTYARKPHASDGDTQQDKYRKNTLGPLAAHALRVCFCQPYDDAGEPTHATAKGACLAGKSFLKGGKLSADHGAKHAGHSLPIARVVGSGRRSELGDTKRATRRDSAADSAGRRRSNAGIVRRKVD